MHPTHEALVARASRETTADLQAALDRLNADPEHATPGLIAAIVAVLTERSTHQ